MDESRNERTIQHGLYGLYGRYESGETEVKKQELIEKWGSAIEAAEFYGKGKEDKLIEYMRDFVDDLNQLDEPEVLSDKWIDEHAFGDWNEYVYADDLKEIIVPKQELPVIPKFVADWLDDNIERYKTVYSFIISLVEVFGDTVPEKVWTYASEKPDTMARAYLDGYMVGEEQKYYVLDKEGHLLIRGFSDGTVGRVGDRMKPDLYPDWNKKNLPLTEQEIKDYDPRYFAFAVKVEELEE